MLLTDRCAACDRPGPPVCEVCAAGLEAAPPRPPPPGVDSLVAVLAFTGVARRAVAGVKYRGRMGVVEPLARALADRLVTVDAAEVCWVPSSARRRRARGVDHAEVLARALGRTLATPVRGRLARLDATTQTGRSAEERWASPPRFVGRGQLAASVVLVDDVLTTGATLASAAAALRAQGAQRVVGAVAALTP